MLQNKGHEEVHDQWRTQGYKRGVDEVFADRARFYAQFAAPPLADPKGLAFEEMIYAVKCVHDSKVAK